jgi:uncharacterized membrane protein YsdA (DUF1294 family)/cold shock CspA family protein
MSRLQGELVEWNDDRGFGFIRADADGQRHFVHVRQIRRIVNRPRAGDRLSFAIGRGIDGRPAAIDAEILGGNPLNPAARDRNAAPRAPRLPDGATVRLAVVAVIAVAVGAAALAGGPSLGWLPLLYLVAGLVSIAVYWIDKTAAEADRWRIPERTLHLVDLCFGIGGGLLAQAMLRHKTSKPDFARVTYAIATIHLCGLAALAVGLRPQ